MQIPRSQHGGIHPELAARITAAKAMAADFDREAEAYGAGIDTPMPDWQLWAIRLGASLSNIISLIDRSEIAGPLEHGGGGEGLAERSST